MDWHLRASAKRLTSFFVAGWGLGHLVLMAIHRGSFDKVDSRSLAGYYAVGTFFCWALYSIDASLDLLGGVRHWVLKRKLKRLDAFVDLEVASYDQQLKAKRITKKDYDEQVARLLRHRFNAGLRLESLTRGQPFKSIGDNDSKPETVKKTVTAAKRKAKTKETESDLAKSDSGQSD